MFHASPASPQPEATDSPSHPVSTFRSLGVLSETAEALEAVGITTPFPIQEMTLPVALSGHDVIGQAKTGTGKTLGFGLPVLDRIVVAADVEAGRAAPDQLTDSPQALVVVPTRELCGQVTNDLQTAGKVRNVRVLPIYGGRAYEPQVEALASGVDVVVGTPGRLLDLAGQKKLRLDRVRVLVLDEADEMLDLGFLPDVEKIMALLPAKRQTMLFSATMPGQVISLARRYMDHPTHIRAAAPDDTGHTVTSVSQHVFRAHSLDKVEMLARILQSEGRGLAMIFCRTKRTAADVAEQLRDRGFAAGAVHGDLAQGAREQALRAFRNGKVDVLVCTDVAARGIDVEGVTHVVNYQCPEDEKVYLHRIGRTGRAGASGTAVTLVDWDDVPRWQLISKALELDLNDPEETYSTSPHLYELLRIPAGTKGVLPRSERTRAGLEAEQIEDLGETGQRGRAGAAGRGRRPERGASGRPEAEESRPAGRKRQRRRTRSGTPTAPAAESPETAAPPAAGGPAATGAEDTQRRRRRTRRGNALPAGEAVAAEEAAVVPAPAAAQAAAVTDAVIAPDAEESAAAEPRAPRRRTRRTGVQAPEATGTAGPQDGAPAVSEAGGAGAVPQSAENGTPQASEAAAGGTATAEAARPRRRRRTDAAAEKAPAAEQAAAVETVAVEVEEPPVPAQRTRTRTRRAAPAAAPAAEAPDGAVAAAPAEAVEVPAAAPRRRTRRTAEPAVPGPESPASQSAAAEAAGTEQAAAEQTDAPKRRRARRTAEPVATEAARAETAQPEPAEAAAPEPDPAPARRSRTRKQDAEAVAGEAAPAAAPRRRRSTAAAAEEAAAEPGADTAEAPARRRSTRRAPARAAAESAQAPAAEGAAASGGTAEPVASAAEPEAAPRRRARRTAAPAAEAAAPAEGAEVPAPRRRARRVAADTTAAEG